ncbi:hypothetical protein LK996_11725 [Lysobacter sp. A6]|uniref:RNA polymerase sigma factor 70 region 4 type 2 domain-containing protein n=1 Tax=Noviluteimonas lactosilytica TaxID=2888523 RepID=A0ABS8JJG5_9GAMM|nr:sigma factor-like helix-turn-helix DNA-binding protein [Lysobacter lactosilyticus]MCC8363740.1 hypothetical protein [Lysobacter lactosilyticus]
MDKEYVWSEFLAVLDSLPPTTRAVFLLHRLFDASFEDIERTTGVRREACRDHLDVARRAMCDAARRNPDSKQADSTQVDPTQDHSPQDPTR